MGHKINPATGKQLRGFACMTPEQRREVSAKGGSSVSPDNRSFSKDRALAEAAGRKGGEATRGVPKNRPQPREA